jgi:hypothetical protein
LRFFYGVFVRFSTRGVQKHQKKLFGENPCQKLLAEKVEKQKLFSCRLFPSTCFIAFLAVSLHEEPKNTIKTFSKIRPDNNITTVTTQLLDMAAAGRLQSAIAGKGELRPDLTAAAPCSCTVQTVRT